MDPMQPQKGSYKLTVLYKVWIQKLPSWSNCAKSARYTTYKSEFRRLHEREPV